MTTKLDGIHAGDGSDYVTLTDGFGNVIYPGTMAGGTALGYQQIVGLASSTALTVPTGATVAVITVETQSVRYRDDGTAPTASVGMLVPAGTSFAYQGPLSAIRFIQTVATATLDVSYYK